MNIQKGGVLAPIVLALYFLIRWFLGSTEKVVFVGIGIFLIMFAFGWGLVIISGLDWARSKRRKK